MIEISHAAEEVKIDKLRAQLTDYNPQLKQVKAKNDYVAARLPEQKEDLHKFISLVTLVAGSILFLHVIYKPAWFLYIVLGFVQNLKLMDISTYSKMSTIQVYSVFLQLF